MKLLSPLRPRPEPGALPAKRLLALAALASTLLAGCVDCFDGAELEAAYREGEAQAEDINAGEYQRGRLDAAQLTFEDGLADGDADGYAAGYNDGFYGLLGYASGFELGYLDGHDDGVFDPTACDAGANDGYVAGHYDGYDHGWSDGYTIAYDDGYEIGIADGESSCDFLAIELERDEPQICRDRGYDHTLDRGAFDRGYADGRRDNPEYQAGYAARFDPAYEIGHADGQIDGWDAGYVDGYDGGYIDGYDAAYYDCRDQAYPDGFDDGYAAGWDASLGPGFDDGYASGFEDGRAEC
jgi:hypothetical protein